MSLHYATIGDPSNPPLLFLHGLGASSEQTTSALTDLGNTFLIAPDMPGHGQSLDFDPECFSFDYFADQVIALMDELRIEKTDLGGLSMGSGIALNLTLRFPERVNKLIILRPSWLDQPKPPHLALVAKYGLWLAESDAASAQKNLLSDPAYQNLLEANPPVAKSIQALFDRPDTPATTQVLYRMWQSVPFPSLEILSEVDKPTLVLDTSRDELHPLEVAKAYADHIAGSTYETLPPRYHDNSAYKLTLNAKFNQFLDHRSN